MRRFGGAVCDRWVRVGGDFVEALRRLKLSAGAEELKVGFWKMAEVRCCPCPSEWDEAIDGAASTPFPDEIDEDVALRLNEVSRGEDDSKVRGGREKGAASVKGDERGLCRNPSIWSGSGEGIRASGPISALVLVEVYEFDRPRFRMVTWSC